MATTCQILYDLQKKYSFCSAGDLHSFFRSAVGEPSPSGYTETEIDGARALEFVEECCDVMSFNSPSLAGHCERTKIEARRKLAKKEKMSKEEFKTFIKAELKKPRGPYDGVISIRPRGKYVGWLDEVITEMGLEPNRGVCDKNYTSYWALGDNTRALDVVEEIVF